MLRIGTWGQVRAADAGLWPVGRLARAMVAFFAAERERWLLWVPVGLGLGVGLYFLPRSEPPLWLGPAAAAAAILVAAILRRRAWAVIACAVWGVVALGFAAAQVRTAMVAAPAIEKRIGPLTVTGRIVRIQTLAAGRRVVLDRVALPGVSAERTPKRVRIRLRGAKPELRPGQIIALRAVLSPPPPPVAPGAFDFQRHAFFKSIGAVGFALGAPRAGPESGRRDVSPGIWLAALRQTIFERIVAGLDGAPGAVAAALMTGIRGAIPAQVLGAMRDSGLAHLLAISGLHIGLVAGILFFGVRAVLALIGPVAIRTNIKKWAALAALAGAFAYLLVSGATVPTQRAYVMVAIVLLGVLTDRTGLSMRLVAWAAVVVLLSRPESILGASFQMSFAAVVALIAAYEAMGERFGAWRGEGRGWRRVAFYAAGVAFTTVVAGLATSPFAVFHFNRIAVYSVAANLVAVPATALWIMPWALVAFILMPFGLESVALAPMGWGLELVIGTAETVAAWPGAVVLPPAMPVYGIALVAIGGLWLALWRRTWRLAGLPVLALGLATAFQARPPDILVSGNAKLMAVRAAHGGLMLSSRRAARFSAEMWLRREGQRERLPWPGEGQSADGRMTCDGLGCIYRAGGEVVALVRDANALAEDCYAATVVVSTVPVRAPCPSARVVIDRFDLWRNGSYALWLGTDGVRVENARESRGQRPWVVGPKRRVKAARRGTGGLAGRSRLTWKGNHKHDQKRGGKR